MLFTLYERNIIWPLLHYWGFFTNCLELPNMGSVVYSFRVNRKEFNFILTFLVFFIKCFFLNQKISFSVDYSNLRFEVRVKKKDNNFLFFFFLLNFLSKFMFQNLNLKKKFNDIGKKGNYVIAFSTSKFFLCMYEIFNIGFLYFPKNDFMFHVFNLFQNVFYSSRSLSFNLNIFINMKLNKKYNFLRNKIFSFYL